MQLHELFLLYFLFISAISAFLTVYDKHASKCRGKRIRERTLMFCALIFGSLSMYITMVSIRHKTRHLKFMLGLPLLIIFNVVLVYVGAYMVKFYG